MGDEKYTRQRVVVLGAGGVGKSSLIARFLDNTFTARYKETVEDLYCREYNIRGYVVKVDLLDTAGNLSFPAMRRLSISTANAFVLVYAYDDVGSFEVVKQIKAQIEEQRDDYHEIPVVIVGNKSDLPTDAQRVGKDIVRDWFEETWIDVQAHVEASAKTGANVTEIFRKLLELSKLAPTKPPSPVLQRRLSAQSLEHDVKQFHEKQDAVKRSRSLMRRPSKPRVKQAAHAKPQDDCLIS